MAAAIAASPGRIIGYLPLRGRLGDPSRDGFVRAKAFRGRVKIRLPDLRSIRAEMARCYGAWVRKEIDDNALRSGTLGLARMAQIDQGQLLEGRIAALEARLEPAPPTKPNGGSYVARPS
jgi:hypothetical protein